MVLIAIGRFEDEKVAALGRIGVGQDGGIGATEVAGEDHPVIFVLAPGESEQDKERAEDMPGIIQLEGDPLFEGKGMVQFKAPRQLIDEVFRRLTSLSVLLEKDMASRSMGKSRTLVAWGVDYLAFKPGIDQVRRLKEIKDLSLIDAVQSCVDCNNLIRPHETLSYGTACCP